MTPRFRRQRAVERINVHVQHARQGSSVRLELVQHAREGSSVGGGIHPSIVLCVRTDTLPPRPEAPGAQSAQGGGTQTQT